VVSGHTNNGSFSVYGELRSSVARLHLSGELDLATVPMFTQALSRASDHDSTTVVLDLRELRFMDSSGLNTVLRAHKEAQGNGGLAVWNATGQVRQLLGLTHADLILLDKKRVGELLGKSLSGTTARWEPIPGLEGGEDD
jgi:anti-sigma B factor antagonist